MSSAEAAIEYLQGKTIFTTVFDVNTGVVLKSRCLFCLTKLLGSFMAFDKTM